MKLIRIAQTGFLVAAASVLITGCSSVNLDDKKPTVETRTPKDVNAGKTGDASTGTAQSQVATVDASKNRGAAESMARIVYFDFDSFVVKDEFRPLVEAHAKYLRENPGAKMLIQGNADERGSREYNVGLGQRRSDSVKRALTLLGAKENQIESVSLGEEKPVCTEHAEDCWAKNRRADMLYSGEY